MYLGNFKKIYGLNPQVGGGSAEVQCPCFFYPRPLRSVGLQTDIFSFSFFFPPPACKDDIYVFLLGTDNAMGGGGCGSLAVYAILFLNEPSLSHFVNIIMLLASFSLDKKSKQWGCLQWSLLYQSHQHCEQSLCEVESNWWRLFRNLKNICWSMYIWE